MTGTEYWRISEGDTCILTEDITTCGLTWHKGDKIIVAYRNTYEESIYVYNPSVLINNRPSYKKLGVLYFLKAIQICKDTNSTTFLHKFNVGDTVYYMEDNKVKSSIITNITYYIWNNGTKLSYYLNNLNDHVICKEESKLFSSKEELLNSL